MPLKVILAALLALSAARLPAAARTAPRHSAPAGVLAFVNVNVVPMDRERVLSNQTVLVRGDRILEVGPAGEVKVPRGAARVEGRGRYLLPGLVDMHAHLNSPRELPLYLANGVTAVYNLNGRPAHLLWRGRVNRGEMSGPTIYTCGPTIRTARKADEAARIVEEQWKAGYDSIKVYNAVSKEAYAVLTDGAKRRGMLAVGHIPREPGLEGVLRAGQAIAHAEEYVYTFFKDDVDDHARIPEAARLTRDAGVPVIPTLVAFDHIVRQAEDLPGLLSRPEFGHLAPWVRADWGPGRNLYQRQFANAESIAYLKKSLALQKKLVQALHRAGVRIFVGTDAMNMGVVPGYSVHEELRNLVALGFTPFEALRAATAYPAEFLRPGEFGAVAAGRRADLILVGGNPLADVAEVSDPVGVLARGRWLPAAELRRMLGGVAGDYLKEERFVKTNLERDTARALAYLAENDPFDNLLNEAVTGIVLERGVAGFRKLYEQAKLAERGAPLAAESFVNALGYRLLGRNRPKEAIEVFKFNVEAYPKSGNTYDSLAEAYLGAGEKRLALDFYRKALEVEPDYPNAPAARDLVKKLEAEAGAAP